MTPRQLRKNCSMEALASVENLFLATAGARRNKSRSRENGKSPGSLIELFFKRFRVRSQRVKFVLRQKPDVWQHNFFGLRQLTHSWIHKALGNYDPGRLASSSGCVNFSFLVFYTLTLASVGDFFAWAGSAANRARRASSGSLKYRGCRPMIAG